MKITIIPLLVGVVLSCTQATAQKPEFKEHIHKEFSLSKAASGSTLAIYNINGFVKVEGYSGDKVIIEIDKSISAKDEQTLEQGKKEFKLQFDQNTDSVIVYIEEPYDSRPNRNRNRQEKQREIKYHCNLDFTIKVPNQLNLHVATINGGEVTVANVSGTLRAFNVNGPITLTNIKGTTEVRTINGNVVANYLEVPSEKSSYYTLNGDLKISYPPTFSADCEFKTFQGEFFTDFTNTEVLPTRVTKTQENRGDGTVYKLNKDTSIRIGNGGKTFKFETFNGNVYIKKQS